MIRSHPRSHALCSPLVHFSKQTGKVLYLLKWKGYPSSSNTWEPRVNLSSDELLFEFEKTWTQAHVHVYVFSEFVERVLYSLPRHTSVALRKELALGFIPASLVDQLELLFEPPSNAEAAAQVERQVLSEVHSTFLGIHTPENVPHVAKWVAQHYPRFAHRAHRIAEVPPAHSCYYV